MQKASVFNGWKLWHLSHEGGDLEDPWNEAKEHVYLITDDPANAPKKPEYVVLNFEKGVPTKLNERNGFCRFNSNAQRHGKKIRYRKNRHRRKSLGRYEKPRRIRIAWRHDFVIEAHRALQILTVERDLLHYSQVMALKYADLIYYGQWFSPLRASIDAFFDESQEFVTGEVRVKLTAAQVQCAGVRSPYSLYNADLATFERDDIYNQKDAEGFIKLFGLPLKVAGMVQGKNRK